MKQTLTSSGTPNLGPRRTTVEARQAVTGTYARYVLAISLSAALAVLAVIYVIFAAPW